MSYVTALWLVFGFLGFVLGLWIRPMLLLRAGIALVLLGGVGLVLSNTAGWEGLAWWFGAGMVALGVVFGLAIVGAAAGALVRRMVGAGRASRARVRDYNSII